MKLSIPAFIHNKQLTELVNDLYTEYGEVVKVMCQPFETIKRGQRHSCLERRLFNLEHYIVMHLCNRECQTVLIYDFRTFTTSPYSVLCV